MNKEYIHEIRSRAGKKGGMATFKKYGHLMKTQWGPAGGRTTGDKFRNPKESYG